MNASGRFRRFCKPLLRAEVLQGQARPEGLGAAIYHGHHRWSGVAVFIEHLQSRSSTAQPIARDRELLPLLANMVCRPSRR